MPSPNESKKPSKGLGDTIAKVTKATGIDKLVHAVVGEDCGCEERRKKLNQLFPYAQPMDEDARRLFEDTFTGWQQWPKFDLEKQRVMVNMLTEATGRRVKLSRCGSCIRNHMKTLQTIYENSCPNE